MKVEEYSIALHGGILADALDRVVASGRPGEDELALFLCHGGDGDLPLAAALARALGRYWNGDWEGCVHTAVPRIEAAARGLVLRLDLTAYRVARASEPGKYVGLGVLLSILARAGLDPAWERFLRTFLTGPLGMNVRNDVAHGFVVDPPSRETAALAVRALALLVRLLTPEPELCAAPAGPALPPGDGTVVGAVASLARAACRRPSLLPGLLADEARRARPAAEATRAAHGRNGPSASTPTRTQGGPRPRVTVVAPTDR